MPTDAEQKMRNSIYLWAFATMQIKLLNDPANTNEQVVQSIITSLGSSKAFQPGDPAVIKRLVTDIVKFIRTPDILQAYSSVVGGVIAIGPPDWTGGTDHPGYAELDTLLQH